MTNIYDLTNLLREVRSRYQAEHIDAMETNKKELATFSFLHCHACRLYKFAIRFDEPVNNVLNACKLHCRVMQCQNHIQILILMYVWIAGNRQSG